MIIKKIQIRHFRNLENIEIDFNQRLNIFIGNNGQGKTNILEALYLCTESDSFRYSKNENLIQIGQSNSAIQLWADNDSLDYKINLKINASKKNLILNEKPTTHKKMQKFFCVLFSPESLNIIKESADERRKLIDQLVSQSSSSGSDLIYDFKKVLKTRNKILKDVCEQNIDLKEALDILKGLNQIFLEKATSLTIARIKVLNEIKPDVQKNILKLNSDNSVSFNFKYIISDNDHSKSTADLIHETLRNRMNDLHSAELKIGSSLVGPQKHDVIFLYNENDSRFYCSQGQQRSIILAYKMAQIVYHHRVNGFYPLLLLDDVLSELDLQKQEALVSALNQTETQTFITTTDVSLLPKLSLDRANIFKLSAGKIV